MGAFRLSRINRQRGFSLLELSIVIAIISVVAVMGLEMAAAFLSRSAYQSTQDAINTIDAALVRYRAVYGRLPCPARLNVPINNNNYGKEDCDTYTIMPPGTFVGGIALLPGGISSINVTNGGAGYTESTPNSGTFPVTFSDTTTPTATDARATAHIDDSGTIQYISFDSINTPADSPGYGFKAGDAVTVNLSAGGTPTTAATVNVTISPVIAGALPVRDLGLPLSAELDGFGGKFIYYVSYGLADWTVTSHAYRFATENGVIQVRQGQLAEPCIATSNCNVLQAGAAYAIISPGKDQRGAYNKRGAKINDCIPAGLTAFQIAPDAQNCKFENESGLGISFAAVPPSTSTTTPFSVIYNNLFNNGNNYSLYSDDIVVTRMKSDL